MSKHGITYETVTCPNCKKPYGNAFHDEWLPECMSHPANIICHECGCKFKIQAIPQKVRWTVELATPKETP